jgi:hypothetical protein
MKKIKDLFNKLKEVKRWKMYIYYNGVLIKTKKVKQEQLKDLKEKKLVLTIYNKRQLFSSFKVNIVVKPVVLLLTDNENKRIYIGVVIDEGVKL